MEKIRSAEIICTGTELLLGDIINTNASFMAERLAELGIPLYRQTVVGDNPERLKEALADAYSRSDTVFLSGGLGPTKDDLTKETVADLFGLPMRLDEDTLERIRNYFRDVCRKMTENNIKQAMVPEGAVIFENANGTAPGLAVEAKLPGSGKTVRAVLLPGPPVELVPLWYSGVVPYLVPRSAGAFVSRNVHLINIGESTAASILGDLLDGSNPTVAPYCKEGEVRLRVTASAPTEEEAAAAADRTVGIIKESEVGKFIYGIDVGSVENALLISMRKSGLTLATAESCTGGLIGQRITSVPGCSDVYLGGCVSYANSAKEVLAGVPGAVIDEYGAVSEQTAAAMAKGIRRALGASAGISSTGFAGPGGGTEKDPVGTVYVAVAYECGGEETVKVKRLTMSPLRSREHIRNSASTQALGLALEASEKIGKALAEAAGKAAPDHVFDGGAGSDTFC